MNQKLNLTEMAAGRIDSAIIRAENDQKEIMQLYDRFYTAWRQQPGVEDTSEARKALLAAFAAAFLAGGWTWAIVPRNDQPQLQLISWRQTL